VTGVYLLQPIIASDRGRKNTCELFSLIQAVVANPQMEVVHNQGKIEHNLFAGWSRYSDFRLAAGFYRELHSPSAEACVATCEAEPSSANCGGMTFKEKGVRAPDSPLVLLVVERAAWRINPATASSLSY
jgi:hypothetical protein